MIFAIYTGRRNSLSLIKYPFLEKKGQEIGTYEYENV